MKLIYSQASPYARKVRACAIALGIDRQIELVEADVADPPDWLLAANPLGRVPTLIAEDGFAIFDSAVICEYLNGSAEFLPIIPPSGAARWLCLRLEALGDGLMDAAVSLRQVQGSGMLPAEHPLARRHLGAIERTLGHLEKTRPAQHVDVGTISIACGLGYLDLRFPAMEWRATHPQVASWHAQFSRHPCLSETAPKLA
jgi:glutathione S-transferase